MLKMFGGMNPAKMQGMMKKMGISQTNLPVKRVVFEMEDSILVIEEPSVIEVKMQGQTTFQISGEIRKVEEGDGSEEEGGNLFDEEDVKIVVEKTGKGVDEVRKMLEKVGGDIAEAIVGLK